MNNSTNVPHTSKLQRSELLGQIIKVSELSEAQCDAMFALMILYYEIQRDIFDIDLVEKEHVILMTDADSGEIKGFSTMMQIHMEQVTALFSGDTIIHQDYRHTTVLPRYWAKLVFSTFDSIKAEKPEQQVYWFLITSGYKTYRYLPLFFREFYPRHNRPTPPDIQHIMHKLAQTRYPNEYDPKTGVIHLQNATPLQDGVATIEARHLRNPHIAFFNRVNSGHINGDELVCLTDVDRGNLTRAGKRMLSD